MNPKRKKHLYSFWRPLTNLNHQSTISKELYVQEVIKSLNPKISLGYNLITGTTLKELPTTGIKYLAQLFIAVLLKGYFLAQWKVAQIILILKPGEPPNELTSYRPMSLTQCI
jgi:hypothetical protein